MEPCRFVRLIVESLVLKLPAVAKPAGPGVHPSATPCFCTLRLEHGPTAAARTVPLPVSADPTSSTSLIEPPAAPAVAAPVVISLDPGSVQRLAGRRSAASLTVAVYVGRAGGRACWLASGRLLGRVRVAVDLEEAPARPTVVQSGWVSVGMGRTAARLHLVVRSEPDPRFVFQFGGEPECSPVVYQVQGTGGGRILQPVFSCRFSVDRRRSTRSLSLSLASDVSRSDSIRSWFAGGERDHRRRREQRKGWTVTIHDLSGSPVAAASMVTPFVPSPGSDRVSRSNPGAWLILRAVGGGGGVGPPGTADSATTNWKPWGRLEAWRERGPADGGALGYRFQLVPDAAGADVPIAESSIGARKGGQFRIDVTADLAGAAAGFVMGSTVDGERKQSKPTVQVGVQHVSCMPDVALFIALSAAVDLSMDACRLFSQKLRKELCHDHQDSSI